ncbi:MinD/ParA family protein [Falsibacillus pallidus]|uniref:Flagellar biosynthesis protein FlhG n=1 Tax=Falsibacillus pallidus TaxID=493781 RepID=A0A370GVA3_9BACI|nr:MinD/ParA family protein [Falsibacillus pallidus]RDI47439.1 flagellar biosynthesis protein FlhG [Falsibacillus pallidus]
MNDQAARLRERMMKTEETGKSAKTIAIVSGKGGVGKSNISVNFGLKLAKQGHKVLLVDMDIGMGNIHLLLGTSSERSIVDYMLSDDIDIEDVKVRAADNFTCISGGNGLSSFFEMDQNALSKLLKAMELLQKEYNYILFDMGAGATNMSLQFLLSVDDIIVVTTPEPTSVTDAYSMIKFMTQKDSGLHFSIICNRVETESEGRETIKRLRLAAEKFLKVDVRPLGMLPEDSLVKKSVLNQRPFTVEFPLSKAAQSFNVIVQNYLSGEGAGQNTMQKAGFLSKLKHLLFERQGNL